MGRCVSGHRGGSHTLNSLAPRFQPKIVENSARRLFFWHYEIFFGIMKYCLYLGFQSTRSAFTSLSSLRHLSLRIFWFFQIVSLTGVLRSIRWNFDRGSDVIIFRWCDNVIPTVNTGRAPPWAPHAPIMAFIYYTNHSLGAIFQSKHKYTK